METMEILFVFMSIGLSFSFLVILLLWRPIDRRMDQFEESIDKRMNRLEQKIDHHMNRFEREIDRHMNQLKRDLRQSNKH